MVEVDLVVAEIVEVEVEVDIVVGRDTAVVELGAAAAEPGTAAAELVLDVVVVELVVALA